MDVRQPAYEVILNSKDFTITVRGTNGSNLPDRAKRDLDRMQWIAVGHGWTLDYESPLGPLRSATATFLAEEFVAACRYIEYCNQGISVIRA